MPIVGYRIEGLSKALRALEAAGADSDNLRGLMHQVGELVAARARELVPYDSGMLHSTIRSGYAKQKATIRAGFDSRPVKYAAVIHYGWPKRSIKPRPFLTKALEDRQLQALAALEEGMGAILHKRDLK